MSLPTGTVTFLFTDIEGSTRMWEAHPETMQSSLARHDALLRMTIESHHGHVFKTVGDAFCAAFSSSSEALTAALFSQQALHAETWPQETPLRVRMALHTGQTQERDNDYFGPTVNRVARLLAIGHGGQVLLSAQANTELGEEFMHGGSLLDLGSHRLKDLQLPEHVYQLLHPDLPADFPPLKSLQAYANNLPVQLTSFIGRETEITQIKRLLTESRLLTLTGSGGCGKTRLALQVAADWIEVYADGVWLVELAAISDPALVPQQVVTVLGLREEPGRTLTQTLTDYLHSKSVLVLLDNCEHLLLACASLSDTLLKVCPNLRILATSREGLGLLGEQVYRVPSLLAPDPERLPEEAKDRTSLVAEYDSVRLFVERARLQRLEFDLTTRNAGPVASVCSRLDGIPLAIELAAARVKVLTVEEIEVGLANRFELLTGGSKTVLPRQQTLRAAMEWSYDLLSVPERRLLQRASVFAGGWTLEAARKVCSDARLAAKGMLDVLTGLVDKSLVVSDEREGRSRYRMLETVREYGKERLAQAGEEAQIRGSHRDYFLGMAEEAEPHLNGPEQGEWLERLEEEHDNLRAALAWCQAEPEGVEAGLRLAGVLGYFWQVRGYLGLGRRYLAEVLEREGSGRATQERAKVLNGAGGMAYFQSDYEAARALLEERLMIFRELGDMVGVAQSLNNLGTIANDQGDNGAARALHEESLTICRELGNKSGIAFSLNNLGLVANDQGDNGAAKVLYEESLMIFRELGNRRGIAYSLNSLGTIANDQGDYEAARALLEESLTIQRELGNKSGIAFSLNNLGDIASDQGDNGAAKVLYEESLTILRELGDKIGIAYSLESFAGMAARRAGQICAALLWGAAEALREAIRAPLPPSKQEKYEREVMDVRTALGEEVFATVWEQGRTMSLEEAIDYAIAEL